MEESKKGYYAFIHDAAEVRYQYYKNCSFLEVGEPFAEQPLVSSFSERSILMLKKVANFSNNRHLSEQTLLRMDKYLFSILS